MNIADNKYKELILDIYNNGTWDSGADVRGKYADGTPAYCKSVFGRQIVFEEDVVPLLTCKQVYWKAGIKELDLFWIQQTTKREAFEKIGLKFWDAWILNEGPFKDTLGTSYAYQMERNGRNQVKELLHNLKRNPASKRHLVSFWNYEEVQDKALQECCWAFQFHVREDKLDLLLIQRSCDLPLGLPTNWNTYRALQMLVARCTGYKLGRFIHQIGNLHYYDRHEKSLLKVIDAPIYEQPKLILKDKGDDFFNYSWEDFSVENYSHSPFVPFEIAI